MGSRILSLLIILSILTGSETLAQESLDNIPKDIKNSKAYKRYEWFNTQRAYPFDAIPMVYYTNELAKGIKKAQETSLDGKFIQNWTSIGPLGIQSQNYNSYWGILSGRVKSLAIHPDDPLTVYIAAASGGIWKTTDGGDSWMDIGHNLESLSFGAIAIDHENPDIIYAGSGEPILLGSTINFYGKGLFKSIDGGTSWVQITTDIGTETHFSDLVVSPHNPDILLATMASGSCYVGLPMWNEGVWLSTDAGLSWNRTLDVIDAYDVAFHPTDGDIAYAAIGGMNTHSGFYISTDQGETWEQSNDGFQDTSTMARIQFDIALSDPDVIYTVIYTPGEVSVFIGESKAYKSINGGETWEQISVGTQLGGYYPSMGWVNQGFYDLCIAVNPSDPNHVFIGNIELHRTINGSNFYPVRPNGTGAYGSLAHVDYHALKFAPSDNDYLYIGCDGGFYKSLDAGISAISKNDGLETMQFYKIASHPANPDIVFGGLQDNGNAITMDGGIIWNQVTGGDGMACFFDYTYPDSIVYASTQNGWLMKSANGGQSFGTLAQIGGAWLTNFFMHPTDNTILYTANTDIIQVAPNGSTQVIAEDVAPTVISSFTQSQINPDYMIFATSGGIVPEPDTVIIVKVSVNGGYEWEDVTDNIPGEERWISKVLTDPVDENTMYIVRTGLSIGNKVYKTTDLGQSWTNISGDLPDLPSNDLFVDPENTSDLYLANDIGVYQSTNGGLDWSYVSLGMPFVPVFDFDYVHINDSIRYLRVGTHGRSIYQANLADVSTGLEEHEPSVSGAMENRLHAYPNPAIESTNLNFSLDELAPVNFYLYDAAGNIIQESGNRVFSAGSHTISWNTSALENGLYYIRLKSNAISQMVKIVIIK